MCVGGHGIAAASATDFPLRSERLQFVPKTADLLKTEALLRSDINETEPLSSQLSAQVAPGWPPEFVACPLPELATGWKHSFTLLVPEDGSIKTLVGIAGHKVWDDEPNTLQIGCAFVPHAHGQHLGEEVVRTLGKWGLAQPGIDRVVCDVPGQHEGAVKSLERAGFSRLPHHPFEGFLRFELRIR